MNTLTVTILATLALYTSAVPSGVGSIVAGPAGVVTDHGPIGPLGVGVGHLGALGVGNGLGLGVEHGAVVSGPAWGLGLDHGVGVAGLAGHGVGTVLSAPVSSSVVSGPAWGLGLGHGVGVAGLAGHGVAVRGPVTAPAVIAGPAGKIVANGLWGPTAHAGIAGHGHGRWW